MRVNKDKFQFRQRKIKLLGVTVDGANKEPNEINRNEALDYPKPKNVSELRRFLGLTGWFRDFIPDYAIHTNKLTDALRQKKFEWTEEMNIQFEEVKEKLKLMKKLGLPDYSKEFVLKTDASNSEMGAVLLQKDGNGELMPVQWGSKKFTPTECRYAISEKEMYVVFGGIKKFEYEL